ncbi:hypothetical protein QQ008_00430 [Fulvivirgaceae bacterium BMA10]|uniref:Uncharacterized protein n=2 Tax=Splendidivirga corallicola TaxID=3051826 RepID=A0ABT8KGF1_9BACT|nr:hypothetical protein [Fulvivirgaceae bacterium BMA10]
MIGGLEKKTDAKKVGLIRENTIMFKADAPKMKSRDVQYYFALLDPQLEVISNNKEKNLSFKKDIAPLDIFNYWNNKGDEEYYVLLTKVAYFVDQEVGYFNPERLSDLTYIQSTMPDYEIRKLDDKKFLLEGELMSPSIEYDLRFFNESNFKKENRSLYNYCLDHNADLGCPALSSVQHNYRFGKVLLHKTSKMSTAITNYYAYEGGTLVINYTLNYIHNLPPELFGGHQSMTDKIVKGIGEHVENTRKVSEKQS